MNVSYKFIHDWVEVFKRVITQNFVEACHCRRIKFDLKVLFVLKSLLKCSLQKRCEAHADDVRRITPINFSQKHCIKCQVGPKLSNCPLAVRVELVTFGHRALNIKN